MQRARISGVVMTLGVALSGGVHLRLYRGGYRDIHIDSIAGIDLSRSFLLSFISAALITALLVVALANPKLLKPAAAAAGIYAAGAIAAYLKTRNGGLLGFEDTATSTEAVIAKSAELVTLVAAAVVLLGDRLPQSEPARSEAAGGGLAA